MHKFLYMIMFLLFGAFTVIANVTKEPDFNGRVAVFSDGNQHDPDDIGAIAMIEALIWRFEQVRPGLVTLVHLEHSDHIGSNNDSQHQAMIESATGNPGFGLVPNRIYDYWVTPVASSQHAAKAIDRSSETNILTIIQAGPWESMARGFDAADPEKHQYTHIISHSDWNNVHQHFSSHRTKVEFFAQYDPGGIYDGYTPPMYTRIDDQNSYAFRSSLSSWNWLNTGTETPFVYDRTVAAGGSAVGDMSDAGMVFWWLTDNEHPNMNNVRVFFGL